MKTRYNDDNFPLHQAIAIKDFNLAAAGINSAERAIRSRDATQVNAIINGMVNEPDQEGKTPLHVLAEVSTPEVKLINAELANILYSKGADPDAQDHLGNTPLHICAYNIKTEMSKIKSRPKIDDMIHSMSDKLANFSPLLKFFIDKGCDMSLRNNDGFTALQVIASGIPHSLKCIFDQESVARIINNSINGINTNIEKLKIEHDIVQKNDQERYHQKSGHVPTYLYERNQGHAQRENTRRSEEKGCCIMM